MSYYNYQYRQQCFIPGGLQSPALAFPQQCQGSELAVPCSPCSPCLPCTPVAPKVCPVRKTLPGACRPGCVEMRVVQGHSSSSSSCSSSRCLDSCPAPVPQLLGVPRCPQVCQERPGPYSYQWSNSYQYNCGQ